MCVPAYLYVQHMHIGAPRDQETVLDTLELVTGEPPDVSAGN